MFESTKKPPNTEDKARAMAPIPACMLPLPGRTSGTGFMRQLSEEQYWKLVFPSFDEGKGELPEGALACTGYPVLRDPILAGGIPQRTKQWPARPLEGDITIGSGGDRLRILWFRALKFADGTEGGPLAVVRVQESFAEVYAVGAFRRRVKKPLFQLERLGSESLVTATEEECIGDHPPIPCDSSVTVFLTQNGRLNRGARLSLERRQSVYGNEPGVMGRVEYHLTAAPQYTKTAGIQIYEKVVAKDEVGREVRRVEQQRSLIMKNGRLEDQTGPAWDKVFPPMDRRP